MSDVVVPGSADATIALSIHGPAGVLDLVVPAGATAVDVAREYARQAQDSGADAGSLPGVPLLQTALGERLNAAVPLGEAGRLGWSRCTTSRRWSADAAAGSTWSTGALSGGTSSSDSGCEHRP